MAEESQAPTTEPPPATDTVAGDGVFLESDFAQVLLEWASILGPNKYLQAGVAIIAFLIIGKIAEGVISRGILRLASKSTATIDDELVKASQRPVFVTFALLGLILAIQIIGFSDGLKNFSLGVLRTIAILIWYGFFHRALTLVIGAISRDRAKNKLAGMLPLLETVLRVILLALVIYFLFLAWKIDVTAWLASAGIIGLALSFAARDTLSNLFAGVTIAADMPYKKGDFITLETGDRGMVTHIGLRSTRLLTRDDIEITLPNGVIANGRIVNEAGGPSAKHRVRIAVGVAYGSDIDKVMETLEQVANDHEEVCRNPTPRVRFRRFGDSSLDFELLCWIARPVDRGRMLHELHCEIYKKFNSEEIEIPFPQRDLHVRSMPPNIAG